MNLTSHSRALRQTMTDAEKCLWRHLQARPLGCKFRRQAPIGPYIVDFVCHQARLVIEADGGQHDGCEADRVRDAWLGSQGYLVLRFWNHDVLARTEGVLTMIEAALQARKGEWITDRVLP